MTKKSTYEELEQRIQELEHEAVNHMQTEESLQNSEAELKHTIGIVLGIIAKANAHTGYFTHCNPALSSILGFSSEEFLARPFIEFVHPNDRQSTINEVEKQIAGSPVAKFENRYICKDGSYKWLEWRATTADENGLVYAAATDITERKRVEKELQRSEALLKTTEQLTKVGGWEWDVEKQTMFWTDEVYRIHDFQQSEFPPGSTEHIEQSIECYDPKDRPVIMEAFRNCVEKGQSYDLEFPFNTVKGRRIWIRTIAKPIKKNGTIVKVIGNIIDISDRKKMEKTLQESKVKYRSMMNAMKDPVYICSKDYRIEYMNPAMIRTLGCDATGEKCFKAIHGLDEICTWCMHDKTFQNKCFEYDITSPKNNRHYQVSNSPIVHEDGSISKLTIFKDITDLMLMEAQYRQAQKMESVGRLAGGVAHDFNNALSAIMGYTELALMDADPAGPLHADLGQVLKAGRRATDITRQLLAFARKQTIAPEVLDLNGNVESMLKMIRRLIGEDIDLVWMPGKGLGNVKMDPSQIDQILANLCVNARDAIEGVGSITIETENIVFDAAYCADHLGFVPGRFVLLAVSDNGCGMDKETLSNIFEPFFTTKDVDKGTGLGLSTVYGIVKQNNGFINVYSEPGKGTGIKIYLPRHDSKAVDIQEESTAKIPQGHGETILLVEDALSILKLAEKILNGLGYTVLSDDTPKGAIKLAQDHKGEIHLLVTDVIMPEMNGLELSEQLKSLYPDLKCMFMSGYTANAIAQHGVLDEGVHFIQKPFSRSDLAKKVRKVLDQN